MTPPGAVVVVTVEWDPVTGQLTVKSGSASVDETLVALTKAWFVVLAGGVKPRSGVVVPRGRG